MINLKNYNITVFGDSIAKGVVTTSDGKISRIENSAINLLQKHFEREITNQSVFGQTLKRVYEKNYIDNYISGLDQSKKNCVFLALGGNDSDFNWKEIAESPKTPHPSNTPITLFKKYLNEIIKKLKKSNVEVFLITLVPMDAERFFDNVIGKQADKTVVLPFLKNDVSNIYKYQERFSLEIVHCAIKNNCQLIDLRSALLSKRNFLDLICKDGIHPNQRGQKEIAKVFIKLFI